MRLDIVNHVHNYSRCLAYQLSSLILCEPTAIEVRYYLYYTASDQGVTSVIDYFRPRLPASVELVPREQEIGYLRNRAIGRNEVALQTDADWVWFTDTDYVFRRNCLDRLPRSLGGLSVQLVYPRRVFVTDHAGGDILIREMAELGVRDVTSVGFRTMFMNRAIGGIQICQGEHCRKIGYVPELAKQRFRKWRFASDVKFRKDCQTTQPIDLPGVCRIRHGVRGYKDIGVQL